MTVPTTPRSPIDVDPASVQLLLSIVDLGSISRAARRHGYSQPSASRRIRDLERRLGLQLLERDAAGARLSVDGTAVLEQLRSLVRAGDQLLEAAAVTRLGRRQSVDLAVCPAAVRFELAELCARLAGRSAELDLNIAVMETSEVAAGVRDGRFELGVVDGPSPPIGLSDHVLATTTMALVVGVGHRWWDRRVEVDVEELMATPLWLPRRNTGGWDAVAAAVNRAGGIGQLTTAGTGDDDVRLAHAVLGRTPAIVGTQWIGSHATSAGRIRVVPCSARFDKPVRLVWRGRQPGSTAAFAVWHRLRAAPPFPSADPV